MRALHAQLLNLVVRLAEAGRVSQRDSEAAELHTDLNDIARGPWVRRHNRGVAAHELVEQRRFADVRPAIQRDAHAMLSRIDVAALRCRHVQLQLLGEVRSQVGHLGPHTVP